MPMDLNGGIYIEREIWIHSFESYYHNPSLYLYKMQYKF